MAGNRVDSVDVDSPLAERHGDASSTNAELKCGARSGHIGKEAHSRLNDRRIKQLDEMAMKPGVAPGPRA
jgi:hypothetical protein